MSDFMQGFLIGFLLGFILFAPPEADAEEYIRAQVDIGHEIHPRWQAFDNWEGELPIEFTISYINKADSGWFFQAGYSHQSNVLTGPPFNDDEESVLDKVFIGFGYDFRL